ncbi:hypothetical protein PILCRDRAFT_171 [Piloderma croceum F 1598]|uniref:Uncharacterized protein n=1 Tax=Piloderma croceum (strain F 1598) TaxID=765440 RepID=A0A0C3G721_PILCF|nr:hypothetical protein PILCRDRAFT_171 [Piloderma croceum F 1598]
MSPGLIGEYNSVMADAVISEGTSRVQSSDAMTGAEESYHRLSSVSLGHGDVSSLDSHRKLSKKPARHSLFQPEEIDAMILDCSRALSPAHPSSTMPAHQLPSPGPSSAGGSFLDALKSSKSSLLSRLHGKHEKENILLEPLPDFSLPPTPLSISRPPIPLPAIVNQDASSQSLTIVSESSFTLKTRLVMTLCDELISYDLESLEDDPKAIIDLLRATSSERDKWIVVGCHYRRKGNFKAAMLVVRTMVEVMIEHGMSEADLKPAFLMLSSCETELSKRARTPSGENTEASLGHAQKSYHWLQKVYGANSSKAGSNQTNHSGLTLAARLGPIEKISNVRAPDQIYSATSTEPAAKIIIDLSDDSLLETPVTPKHLLAAVPTSPSRLRMLERELQSLRDRETAITTQLHNARSAKRKFEDEFTAERTLRRKLEHKLDDLEGQLDVSKKMEKFALDQMKREVDARRRAEEMAECERNMRREVETAMKAQGTKPLFEDLANMFQRAAKGEGIVLPNVAIGSTSGKSGRVSER